MALSLQLNAYFNPLKPFDMLCIRKAIFIRQFENNVILLKQKKMNKIKSKIVPIAIWTNACLMKAYVRTFYYSWNEYFCFLYPYNWFLCGRTEKNHSHDNNASGLNKCSDNNVICLMLCNITKNIKRYDN
jgi:hypothetical protein